ncbi:hypothetical protein C8R47DRAFT_393100 [Mycena vitilis]|nr:hypothetical protein C8R47DRAFT_393100 [Mycena vitilis]
MSLPDPNSHGSLALGANLKPDIVPVSRKENTNFNPSPEEQMCSIDAEIAWHYEQIALLKAKRNAIAPICRLPNELLSRIIMIYAVDSDELSNLKWTKIMKVCWRWRHLGLAAQPLWACIDLGWSGSQWDRLYGQLTRSGVAPLNVKIAHCVSAQISIILEHSARIQVLEISGEARHIHDLLAVIPQHDFPLLTSLTLDPNSKRDEIPEGFMAVLPTHVLTGGIPNLRKLALSSINLPWTLVRGLESLSLTNSGNSDGSSVHNFDALFAMLRLCPTLQTLRLAKVLPMQGDFAGNFTVPLPALVHLDLRDDVTLCQIVLNHLDFPSSALVHIYPTGVRVGEDVRGILVPLCRRMHAADAPPPSLLIIQCLGSTQPVQSPSYLTMSTSLNSSPSSTAMFHLFF